jgi:hypothetical protein
MTERFFCSEKARKRSELLFGTATRVKTWLLIEYPGVWRADAIESSALPDSVKQQLERLVKRQPFLRPLFIRQSYRRSDRMRCFIVQSPESSPSISRVELSICEELDHLDLSSLIARAEPFHEPMYLVCTHGNHDKCCAKFGIPVYKAVQEIAGDQAWECSHVGGDRFAGNLLCFPHGVYYGHVTPADVPAIVNAYARGDVFLDKYRGRCCYSRAVQAADYFLRRHTGRLAFDNFHYDSAVKSSAWTIRFTGSDGLHEITLRSRSELVEILTCKSDIPHPIPQYELLSYRAPV